MKLTLPCPSRLILAAFLSDRLDEEAAASTSRHVESCPQCQQSLDELAQVPEVSTFHEAWRRREGLAGSSLRGSECAEGTAATVPNHPPRIPSEFGRFRIIRQIDVGTFGAAYLAQDTLLKREVALKIPHDAALLDEEQRSRFLREAEATAKLHHPNIVPLHDAGEQGGLYYLAAEYCAGGNLGQWRREHPDPLPFRSAARLVQLLAEAVEHAHHHGVLHRDIKPSNILIEHDEECGELSFNPKLTDFGLAKLIHDGAGRTLPGIILGTPQYMAPEQVDPTFGPVSVATDVYALGVVLFELTSGRRPIDGDDPSEMLHRLVTHKPLDLRELRPDVPRDLAAICVKCLRKRPVERYQSAAELADDLQRVSDGRATHARPDNLSRAVARATRNYPARAAAVGTIVVLLAVILAGVLIRSRDLVQMNSQLAASAAEQRTLRVKAEESESHVQEMLYVANIQLAAQAIREQDPNDAYRILMQLESEIAGRDLRGFEWYYLVGLVNGDHRELARHDGAAYHLALSPDGKRVASCGADDMVRIVDATTYAPLAQWSASQGEVNCVAFSATGDLLATTGDDGTVALWQWKQQQRVRTINAYEGHAYQVLFASKDQMLVTCGDDSAVKLWQADTGEPIGTLEGHERAVEAIALTHDGRTLITASSDETVGVWNLAERKQLFVYRGHGNRVISLSIMPGDEYAATGSIDQSVQVWRLSDGGRVFRHDLPERVQSLQFSPDGEWLFAGDRAGSLHRFRVERSPDAQHALSFVLTNSWSVSEGRTYAILEAGSQGVITADDQGYVRVWREPSATLRRTLESDETLDIDVACFGWTDDEVVVAGTSGIACWNPSTRERLWLAREPLHAPRLATSTDRGKLVVATRDGAITVWDLHSKARIATWHTSAGIDRVSFAPGADRVVVLHADRPNTIATFDSQTGKSLDRFAPMPQTFEFAIHPHLQQLVSSYQNGLYFWDSERRSKSNLATHHSSTITSIVFSPDGTQFATAGNDHQVNLWDGVTGGHLGTLSGHREAVNSIAYCPQGKTLASAGQRGTVKLWHVRTQQQLCEFELGATIERVQFSRDGRRLVCLQQSAVNLISTLGSLQNDPER